MVSALNLKSNVSWPWVFVAALTLAAPCGFTAALAPNAHRVLGTVCWHCKQHWRRLPETPRLLLWTVESLLCLQTPVETEPFSYRKQCFQDVSYFPAIIPRRVDIKPIYFLIVLCYNAWFSKIAAWGFARWLSKCFPHSLKIWVRSLGLSWFQWRAVSCKLSSDPHCMVWHTHATATLNKM